MENSTYEPISGNPNEPATKEDMAKLMKAFESLFEQTGMTLIAVTETKDDIKEIKTDVSQLKTDVAKLQSDISQFRTEIHSAREEIKQLDRKIDEVAKMRKEDADALAEEFLSLKS